VTITRQKKPNGPSPIQSISSASAKIYWLNLEDLKRCLARAAQNLARKHSEIAEVWLFGSLARGQAVPGSDADLLLALDECNLPFLDRSVHYQPEFCGVGVDIFAYTRQELAQMEEAGHQFLQRVKGERVCLFRRA
jgi:uncharacterized protein